MLLSRKTIKNIFYDIKNRNNKRNFYAFLLRTDRTGMYERIDEIKDDTFTFSNSKEPYNIRDIAIFSLDENTRVSFYRENVADPLIFEKDDMVVWKTALLRKWNNTDLFSSIVDGNTTNYRFPLICFIIFMIVIIVYFGFQFYQFYTTGSVNVQ